MPIRLSHSARECYALCARKYYLRYIKKMRPRAKGSALFFGDAYDKATEALLQGKRMEYAKAYFAEEWIRHENNLNLKFSKTDYVDKILISADLEKLETCANSLGKSKAVKEYDQHKDIKRLVKDIKKLKENSHVRDLNAKEEHFIHYATVLSMLRKGHIMLDSFEENIAKHITKVVQTQVKVTIKHPDGHKVIGYIDALVNMEGYTLANGRILTADDLVVADIKSAGAMAWTKHDKIYDSPQLDTYLVSPEVQDLANTNLIAYFVTSKIPKADTTSVCVDCGHVKTTTHRTCPNEVDGKRCGGTWSKDTDYYCESKIVIGERSLDEAQLIYEDFDDTLTGIVSNVFPRDRNSCNAFGGVCEYKEVCGKCFMGSEDFEKQIVKWKEENGE